MFLLLRNVKAVSHEMQVGFKMQKYPKIILPVLLEWIILLTLVSQKTAKKHKTGEIKIKKHSWYFTIHNKYSLRIKLTCWLELAEGGVTTLWSNRGLRGAEPGR